MFRKARGRYAENIAVRFLKRKGFKVVDRNFLCRFGEIDLIAKDRGEIAFVEVRSTNGLFFHDPLESITYRKMEKLKKTALFWLMGYKGKECGVRFDVVAIVFLENDGFQIRYIKDAF
ncbi:MAG: YraN family protein [Candidatus Omnitrophota bacterium]